ncbi:DMT family transporter [Plantactinospora sp. GCM10030261]|uniref:DMT family transporter n=1 Tax=Plantactinospora sp. GCM10030261 TaxID=3273420 RepID=UPI00360BF04A
MTGLAVLLGVGSAACFALSSALEQHAAKGERETRTLDPRLLLRLFRRPLWLFGWVPDMIGTGLQAVALGVGALALVEPLLLSGVFIAIPLEAALERRRPHRRDAVVVAVGVVGLTAFLMAANPRAGIAEPAVSSWLGVAAAVGVVFATCLVLAWRLRDAARGVLLGVATGVLFGLTAALLKSLTAIIVEHRFGVFRHWQLYAIVVIGFAAFALTQNAFQAGPIAAPLTAIALLDPLVGVLIGVTAFEERISTDAPRLTIQIVAGLVMSVCIWLASTTRSR